MGVLFLSINLSSAFAHHGPQAEEPTYGEISYPIEATRVQLAYGCTNGFFSRFFRCSRSANTEIALEREYWAHVQNMNFEGMQNLIGRIRSYYRKSKTPYAGRLIRLMAFGNVMLAQETAGFGLDKIPKLLTARFLAALSNQKQSDNVNTLSIAGFTDTLMGYAFNSGAAGDYFADKLFDLTAPHDDYGLEAEVVGAMAYTYTTDEGRIREGLDILNDCNDYNCTRTTSLAPFKEVGVMLTIAEARVALGESDNAADILDRAQTFANDNGMPATLMERLYDASSEILTGSYAAQAPNLLGLGLYRQPAGPSQSAVACAICHSGAKVPDDYYSWK